MSLKNHSSEGFKCGQRTSHNLDFNYRKYHSLYLIMFCLFNEFNILIIFSFFFVSSVRELKLPFRKKKKNSTSAFNSLCSVFILKIYFNYGVIVSNFLLECMLISLHTVGTQCLLKYIC